MESTSGNMCRCCASEGVFKDLSTTYHWMGEEEIYGDMLKECLDIQLSMPESTDGGICEVCITQLRNASNFKKQVLHTEEQFKSHLQTVFKPSIVKVEVTREDGHTTDDNATDDGLSGTEYDDIPIIKTEESPKSEKDELEIKPKKRMAVKPGTSSAKKSKSSDDEPLKKQTTEALIEDMLNYKEESFDNLANTEDVNTTQAQNTNENHKSSSESEDSDYSSLLVPKSHKTKIKIKDQTGGPSGAAPKNRKREDISATPERVEHRVNLTAILQYSNASPFRDKTVRGFSCLYCAKPFPNIDDLRQHTAQKKEKDKINKMIDYKLSYNPIKVDITNLRCVVCELPLKDLNELKDHVVSVHKKVIHKHIKDIILPFRLEDGNNFTCVICSVIHISFKNLYHHMSSHYRNYCCDKCGAGYITIAALRKHHKTHAQGTFSCAYCEKTYTSVTKKRNHEKGVHEGGWLRNKCPHCSRVFASYYDRAEHLVKDHNQTRIVYPCNACNKIYKKKYELSRHIKHHHLQQKNYICDICKATFFSKRGLVDHITRHVGSEMFSCDICGKSFSRHRTLREHLRMHGNDTRYQCKICKKNFMQKGGLRNHVRLHQDNLDIFKEFDDVKHLIDNRELTLKQIAAENKKKEQAQKQQGLLI